MRHASIDGLCCDFAVGIHWLGPCTPLLWKQGAPRGVQDTHQRAVSPSLRPRMGKQRPTRGADCPLQPSRLPQYGTGGAPEESRGYPRGLGDPIGGSESLLGISWLSLGTLMGNRRVPQGVNRPRGVSPSSETGVGSVLGGGLQPPLPTELAQNSPSQPILDPQQPSELKSLAQASKEPSPPTENRGNIYQKVADLGNLVRPTPPWSPHWIPRA